MSKRRPIKDIVNSMQNEMENLVQNVMRSNFSEILLSDTENEKENKELLARNKELERELKEMKAQLEKEQKETKDAKKKLAETLKSKKELANINAKLQEKVDLKRENSDLKRKIDLLSRREQDKDKSTTSTSPGTSPQSSPEKIPPKQQDTELESPVKRLKVDQSKKEKPKPLALRKKSPQSSKGSKKAPSPQKPGWIAPRSGIKSKPKISAILKQAEEQKAAIEALKRAEPKPKETDNLFVLDDTFNPAPSEPFTKKKTSPKINKNNMFANFDFSPEPKSTDEFDFEPPKENNRPRYEPFDTQKELAKLEAKWNVSESFFIKKEPKTQDIKAPPPVEMISQEIFTDSNGSVILCDPEPVEIPIYTIPDNTEEEDVGAYGYNRVKRQTSLTSFENYFKHKAVKARDVYEGECDACKTKYDKRAKEIDLEAANIEMFECPLDQPCKGFKLRYDAVRKKPNYVPNFQILRANKRAPRTKDDQERFTPEHFWDVDVSPVKNQHLKPRNLN